MVVEPTVPKEQHSSHLQVEQELTTASANGKSLLTCLVLLGLSGCITLAFALNGKWPSRLAKSYHHNPVVAFNPVLPAFRPASTPSRPGVTSLKIRAPPAPAVHSVLKQGAVGSGDATVVLDKYAAMPAAAIPYPQSPGDVTPLLDGYVMPAQGLGVYKLMPGKDTYLSVRRALAAGYRMIDTVPCIEEEVGRAIRDSKVPRTEIFVQSSLEPSVHGYEAAREAIAESLRKSGLKYYDCLLIQSPYIGKLVETWDALLAMRDEGFIRSVGVANFGVNHLKALSQAERPSPVVNQLEMHPLVYQSRLDVIDYCDYRGILVQAVWHGDRRILKDPRLAEVADAHPGKSKTQVVLRWAIQNDFQVVSASVNALRRHDLNQEALDIFDFQLTPAEEAALSSWKPAGLKQFPNRPSRVDRVVDVGDVDKYKMPSHTEEYRAMYGERHRHRSKSAHVIV